MTASAQIERARRTRCPFRPPALPPRVLAVDVGGSHIKLLTPELSERRRCDSGTGLTPGRMVALVDELAAGLDFDVLSLGLPGPVSANTLVSDPVNLGPGWTGFDFSVAFGKPTRVCNDAAMQALGSYRGGRMLFLGLGTGLGTTLVLDGIVKPLELGHLPYRNGKSFEQYVGSAAMLARGLRRWQADVQATVTILAGALQVDEIVLGGGNAKKLDPLPTRCRLGANANAFEGGFRLWDPACTVRVAD
jgi:polyphosphate glucokinase